MVLATTSAAVWKFGAFRTISFVMLALLLTLAKQLASTPEVNSGHRAGGKGFEGGCRIHSCLAPGTEHQERIITLGFPVSNSQLNCHCCCHS